MYAGSLGKPMIDEADLEVNILSFVQKSFSFDRLITVGDREFVVFVRTETESESKFRPKLLHLRVVVPRAWVILDSAGEALVLGQDGATPGPQGSGTAQEAAAEKTEFREQGITFVRTTDSKGGLLYVPSDFVTSVTASSLGDASSRT